ncbi:MAG: hypothetical protein ACREOK_05555 [Gemmatimonadaceae bacterium]
MSGSKALLVVASAVAIAACFSDLRLSASNLEIGPNPAVPGDVVVATMFVIVQPLQRHTITLTIDDVEHLRVTSTETPAIPYVITLGDAADLIAEYGPGAHSARVEVRAEEANEAARTQTAGFELREAAP